MPMDVAADSHLPQTLQRDPLMADESGYAEEDNRAQTLRDMELYRVVQRFHSIFWFPDDDFTQNQNLNQI